VFHPGTILFNLINPALN